MSKTKVKFIYPASFAPFFRSEDVGETAIINDELAMDLKAAGLVEFVSFNEDLKEEAPAPSTDLKTEKGATEPSTEKATSKTKKP
jgi:hypothetical protein